MKKYVIFLMILSGLLLRVNAQEKDDVVFSVAATPVTVGEYARVYEKNLSLVDDPAQKDVENYMNLYINYKLKLRDAYDMHLDTLQSYQHEYKRYRDQLLEPYMKDKNLEKDLVKEAYDRMKYDVSVSHILLFIKKGQDTLKLYKRINAIRDSIINGASFEEMARKYSDDRSAKKNGGKLNYFTVFDMVYPFESAAYNTPVGEISPVFRTRFGYHFLKVHDKRPARGKIEVAHIMLTGDDAEAQIIKIKEEVDKGASFEELARQYSQDKGTAKRGGKLAKLGVGHLVPEFEDVAYSLQKPGDVSDPVKTQFGWHIIKLIKKYPIGTFEEEKKYIEKKVTEGKRAEMLGKSVLNKLYKKYQIVEDTSLIHQNKPDAVILKVNEDEHKASEYYAFQKANQKLKPGKAYALFKDEVVKDYYKKELEKTNDDVKYTLQEYREGLLLFELMRRKIWDFAEKDSTGLQAYFDKHREQYRWGKRAQISAIICSDSTVAQKARELMSKEGMSLRDVRKELLDMNTGIVKMKEGKFEVTSGFFPKDTDFNRIGEPVVYKDKGQYKVILIHKMLPEGLKELNECRGNVISDYQNELERKWVDELRKKYEVKVNKKVLRKLKRKYRKH